MAASAFAAGAVQQSGGLPTVPLAVLRQSFGRLTGGQARLAYATSALAVQRMLDEAGGVAVANLIHDLGDRVEFNKAFERRIQRSFDEFQTWSGE